MSSPTTKSILKKIQQFKLEQKAISEENGNKRGASLKFRYKTGKSPSYSLKELRNNEWTPVKYQLPSCDKGSLNKSLNDLEKEFNQLENKQFGERVGEKFKKSQRRFIPKSPQECPKGSYFRQANTARSPVGKQLRRATCAVLPEGNAWVDAIHALSEKLIKEHTNIPVPANILAHELKDPWEKSMDLKDNERIEHVVEEAYQKIEDAMNNGTFSVVNNWVEGIKLLEEKLKNQGIPLNASFAAQYLGRFWKHEKSVKENQEAIEKAFKRILKMANQNYVQPKRNSYTKRSAEEKRELRRSEQRRHKKLLEKIEESSSSSESSGSE